MCMVAAHAMKCLLLIAPPGTGKSTVSNFVFDAIPGARKISALTSAGLTPMQEEFTGYRGLLVMDDLGRLQTRYRRLNTITTLVELVYSHYAEDHTGHQHLSISEFHGAAVINCQPVVLREVLSSGEWEATVADKSIRYYHMYRPTEPNLEPISVEHDTTIPFDQATPPKTDTPLIAQLIKRGFIQWGLTRSREHITDMAQGIAALRGSNTTDEVDAAFLGYLLKPVWIERVVIDKESLEGGRKLHSDFLYMCTEFLTYGNFTLEQLMTNYKVSESTARRTMSKLAKWWQLSSKSPTTYAPSDELEVYLKALE